MIVVSYGTEDGIYDRYLNRLRDSCERNGIKTDMRTIPKTLRHEDACRQKPSFILEMIEKHGQPVVWIDADAVVTRPFSLPPFDGDEGWDIGVIANQLGRRPRRKYPYASFVIAVSPTPASRDLLRTWDHLCKWDLSPRGDHHRMYPAMLLQRGLFRQVDLLKNLRHAIVRDFGKPKEKPLETDLDWLIRRVRARLGLGSPASQCLNTTGQMSR